MRVVSLVVLRNSLTWLQLIFGDTSRLLNDDRIEATKLGTPLRLHQIVNIFAVLSPVRPRTYIVVLGLEVLNHAVMLLVHDLHLNLGRVLVLAAVVAVLRFIGLLLEEAGASLLTLSLGVDVVDAVEALLSVVVIRLLRVRDQPILVVVHAGGRLLLHKLRVFVGCA